MTDNPGEELKRLLAEERDKADTRKALDGVVSATENTTEKLAETLRYYVDIFHELTELPEFKVGDIVRLRDPRMGKQVRHKGPFIVLPKTGAHMRHFAAPDEESDVVTNLTWDNAIRDVLCAYRAPCDKEWVPASVWLPRVFLVPTGINVLDA